MVGWASKHPETIYARRWWTLAVLCSSLLLVVLGNSVMNVALKTLATDLGATPTDLQWIVDGYALVFGGLLLTMGSIGDRFGRLGALQTGLLIFGGASVAGLFVDTPLALILARSSMGIGAALVMPATLSILSNVFPPQERGKAFGIWAAFAGLGGAIGPVVGGYLIDHFHWSSIFALNLPVIALGLVGSLIVVPTSRDTRYTPLDLTGAALSIVALGSLLFGIIEGPNEGWTSAVVLGAFGVAAVAWPVFVFWELRSEHPMLPMQYFKDRRFATGNVTVGLTFFAMFAFFFIISQYLQGIREYTAFEAGVRTLPLAVGLILGAPNSDRIAKRFGTPAAAGGGLFVLALALGSFTFVALDTPYWMLAVSFFFTGIGMGVAMAPSTTLIMDAVPRDRAGVGSAMNDTSREVGGAIGIAVIGSTLNSVYTSSLVVPSGIPPAAAAAAKASVYAAFAQAGELQAPALAAAARDAFITAIHVSYLVGTIAALATAFYVWFFMPQRNLSEVAPAPIPPAGSLPPATAFAPSAKMPAAPAPRPGPARAVAVQDLPNLTERLRRLDARLTELERRKDVVGVGK